MRFRSLLSHTAALIIGITLGGLSTIVFAWTGPQSTPPNCVSGQTGCDAPLDVDSSSQIKNGSLSLNGLSVYGNTLLGGTVNSNAYLNFGANFGSAGYGIRDKALWSSRAALLWFFIFSVSRHRATSRCKRRSRPLKFHISVVHNRRVSWERTMISSYESSFSSRVRRRSQ